MGVPRVLLKRWLLVLLTGAGVVAMHAVMDLGGCSDAPPEASMAIAAAFSGTPSLTRTHEHPPAPMSRPGPATTQLAEGPSAVRSMPGHHGCSCLLGHLCLAVLDALGLLLVVGLLLWGYARAGAERVRRRPGIELRRPRAPPDHPPSLPSLVQLCVSRC